MNFYFYERRVILINLLLLGFIKILDNIILTAKSIATYKEKKIISSILVIISQFTFYFIINKVVSDNSIIPIIIISIASGIGNYIAFIISNRFQKDSMWTNVLTSKDMNEMKRLCEILKSYNIKYIVNDSYDRHWDKTYSITIFSMTKNESKMIDEYIKNSKMKYLRKILK